MAHERIYLQGDVEITWCKDKIAEDDTEYILMEKYTELEAYADKLAAGLPMLPKDIENIQQANTDMSQRIAELEAANRWISVKRLLPEKPGMYLVVSVDRETNEPWVMMMFYDFGMFQGLAEVTHWKPLPDPPRISNTFA